MDTRIKLSGQRTKILAAVFLALFVVSVAGAMVSAAPAVATVTVTKNAIPIEGAFVNVFKATENWYGLYYTTGDPVATNVTNASGQCTFSLDPALMYQFQVNYLGSNYQVNSLGAGAIAISLGTTADLRANAMPWIIGAAIAIIILLVLGYIRFTNKAPISVHE